MSGWWLPLVVGGSLSTGYLTALGRRPDTLPGWDAWRTVAWLAGAAVVALALSPPVTVHVHHDARVHMSQHLLLGMYAPLLLVLGAPLTLLLGSAPRSWGRRLTRLLRSAPVRFLSTPVVAAVPTTAGAFAIYLTPLGQVAAVRPEVHALVLVHLLLAGYLFAWALVGPDPAPHRARRANRLAVLVAAAGAHAFLAKLLYARAAEHGGAHGDAATAEAAARLMYYGGDLAEVALAVVLLLGWYRARRPHGRTPGPVRGPAAPIGQDLLPGGRGETPGRG